MLFVFASLDIASGIMLVLCLTRRAGPGREDARCGDTVSILYILQPCLQPEERIA